MRSTCPTELPLRSEPLFADRAAANVMQLMGYTEEELCGVLGCNAQIARENRLRYVRFADGDGGLQAVMAYSGIVFKYLDAGSFSPARLRLCAATPVDNVVSLRAAEAHGRDKAIQAGGRGGAAGQRGEHV